MAIAAVGAAALAYSVYAGERQQASATQARRRTRAAQDEALRQQLVERQRSVQSEMESNRPTPASTVMSDALALGAATDRTGGVDDRLRLSRSSKLGGGT